MKFLVLISAVAILTLSVSKAMACDFCMLGQGINPYMTATGKGLTVQSTFIESNQVYDHGTAVNGFGKREAWQVDSLTAFFPVAEDWTVLITVPYVFKTNIDYDDGSSLNTGVMTDGIGDASLTGRWTIVQQHSLDSTFLFGALIGVKLPTGSTDGLDITGAPIDRHALAGTGSFDENIGLSTSYAVAKKYQITGDIVYSFAGEGKWNDQSHRYGDSLNASLKYYWPIPWVEKTIFIFTGPLLEAMGKEHGVWTDDSGYQASLVNESTGGSVVFWDLGVYSMVSESTIFNLSVAKAVWHDMNYSGLYDADPAEDFKIDLGLTFLF